MTGCLSKPLSHVNNFNLQALNTLFCNCIAHFSLTFNFKIKFFQFEKEAKANV